MQALEMRLLAGYAQHYGQQPQRWLWLPISGSDRRYLRCWDALGGSVLLAYNPNVEENRLFVEYSEVFAQGGIPVPRIYAKDLGSDMYILEDLGDCTLLQVLEQERLERGSLALSERMKGLYRQALGQLAALQVGMRAILPLKPFGRQAMLWDFQAFKYYFVRPSGCPYEEEALEEDFQAFAAALDGERGDFLLFRDFQARNILVRDERVYFIDYQSARRGYLAYDVASLLFQAKARLSAEERAELLEDYVQAVLALWPDFDAIHFRKVFHHWVLLRLLQVLGAYGYKGWVERKAHFLESIGPAQEHLRYLIAAELLPEGLPELRSCLVWLAGADLVKLKD